VNTWRSRYRDKLPLMNIGFVGLGKLGLPTALAMEARGHRVFGCDPLPKVAQILHERRYPHREQLAQEYLTHSRLRLVSLDETVRDAEIVFVAIQTPNDPRFEGVTRLPAHRENFDYGPLKAGMAEVARAVARLGEDRIVVIISTVLPGTIRREILPLLNPRVKLCYNPFFIAMGTTICDFFEPEFVLLGVEDADAAGRVERFYRTIHDAVVYKTSLENAEAIKVLYNTFISTKISFANMVMEMCHRLPGTQVDEVLGGLQLARKRIISPRYLNGGMGDGGACHPRDNIALSFLSRSLGMSTDWFEFIMLQRERQTDWLADLVEQHAEGRPIVLLGRSFKAESSIELGSAALLLKTVLEERGHHLRTWDPYIDDREDIPAGEPMCYFVGTRHPEFAEFPFEAGSVVIDPWRFVQPRGGVAVIRIGG
jgi:UDPglucose 6-dehydrogenase